MTSDHGEHLVEVPGRLGHGGPWYDLVGRVPLILHHPAKLAPARVDSLSEAVDLLPTLLHLLDVPLPENVRADGSNLVPVVRGEAEGDRHAFARLAVRSEHYKCLFETPEAKLLAEEPPDPRSLRGSLYDTRGDAVEARDLWDEKPEVVQECLAAYRERMPAAFARFEAARNDAPPDSAFAIGVRHMQLEPAPARVPGTRRRDWLACAEHQRESGWTLYDHWRDFVLQAPGSANPLEVSFAVPDGRYQLRLRAVGGARIEASGAAPGGFAFPERLEHGKPREVEVEVGPVRVTDGRFRATLTPDPASDCFAVRMFGFEPIDGDEAQELDAARLEHLRLLGYVE